ncbi:hypothetical protein Hdeb2414_s0003g00108441 [Helianthus debilis subsp. tardiflorus]
MNQQNISKTPDLLVKRKRGRPRKDESVARNVKQHTQPPLAMAAPQPPPQAATIFPASNNASKVDPNMVGQVVTCVIDGIFDNGYLLSACVGPNNTVLRGIVFQQGHVAPVTPVNDVAPHVEMCTRGGSSSSLQQESLTMIQQNNLMDVFEMSKTVEGSQACDQRARNEHVVSDPTAENFPERDTVVPKATELEPVVNEQPEGEKPEVITPVETVVENQPSMAKDGLQQESQAQTGEMSGIDANQVQNREIGVDLSLSNFPEI